MRPIFILIFTFLFELCHGQAFYYPPITKGGLAISDFIPVGWNLLDSATGDLNKDGQKDAALILQFKDSITHINSSGDSVKGQPRMLLILFKDSASNGFYVKERSDSFVLEDDNPSREDPYESIMILNGSLKISFRLFFSIGSWYMTNSSYQFRYDGDHFCMIGAEYRSSSRAKSGYFENSYDFLKKKRMLKSENEDGKKTTRWKTLDIPALKTFRTFRCPFSWEIEKEVLL